MSDLNHNELIQSSILETIEMMYIELTKDELDGLILLYIETHIIEE